MDKEFFMLVWTFYAIVGGSIMVGYVAIFAMSMHAQKMMMDVALRSPPPCPLPPFDDLTKQERS